MDEQQRAAFEDLVATRTGALVRTAYLMTGDWQQAEDHVQTALAKTYLRWHRLHDTAAAEAYTRAVLARTCSRAWRRRWRGEVPAVDVPDVPGARDGSAESDERVVLARALAALPASQRAVLVLRFYEDLSEAETARLLGCAAGTVKSRTSRALAALRESGLVDVAAFTRAVPVEETP